MANEGYASLEEIEAYGATLLSSGEGYASLPVITALGYGGDYGVGNIEEITAVGSGGAVNYGSGFGSLATILAGGYAQAHSNSGSGYGSLFEIIAVGSGDYVSVGSGYGSLSPLQALGFGGTVVALVLNSDTGEGPFPYSNFDFNSIFEYEGRLFLSSSLGLFELTGVTDNGSSISAYFETLQDDFGSSELKNIPDAFVGMNAGALSIQTSHDGHYSKAHTLSNTGDHLVVKRAKLGMGLRQVRWGVKVSNVSGSAFKVDFIELPVTVGKRKINQ